jgi:manganese/zinc/iron transport system substrate-binding protein
MPTHGHNDTPADACTERIEDEKSPAGVSVRLSRLKVTWVWLILGLLLSVAVSGCGSGSEAPASMPLVEDGQVRVPWTFRGSYPIRVVCTTGMVEDLVRHTGGEWVQVHVLMGPGVDPHLYKARPNDVALLQRADLVFYSGLHLEGKMAEVLENLPKQGRLAFAVTAALSRHDLLAEGEQFDPHVWFDVRLWHKCLLLVRDVFMQYDPQHAEDYRRNAEAYGKRLLDLDQWAREQIQQIPPKQRLLVTAHDAFRYFGRAYGIEVHGIQGISTESEASTAEIDALVELLVTRNVKAIFVESSVNPRNVQAVVEGCRRRGHKLRIGGELYSDAMGEYRPGVADEDNPGTYLGMIRHNVRTIVEALR